MERAIWVHQFNQLGEQTAAEIAATLLPRNITRVYVKAMDGTTWMGSIYSHPLAPRAATWSQTITDFANNGLQLLPWVVNRRSASEAGPHLECGYQAGGLLVDFEYQYAGFWQGTDSAAYAYFDALRAEASSGWIAIAPDPRQVRRDYGADMIYGLSAYLPQNYWTDFQQPVDDVMNMGHENLTGLGPIEPILPYNGTRTDVQRALTMALEHGDKSVSMWRMGTADADQLDAFAEHVPQEDDVQPPPTQEQSELEKVTQERNGLVSSLGMIAGDWLRPVVSARTKPSKSLKRLIEGIRHEAEAHGIEHA